MKKLNLATHNSATGEGAANLLSWLLTPFARCQSKTLAQQYHAGVRLFDIRVRWCGDTLWCYHGLYKTAVSLNYVFHILNMYPDDTYVRVSYEGRCPDRNTFVNTVRGMADYYKRVTLIDIREKATWDLLWHGDRYDIAISEQYHALKWFTWRLLLPLPWLWATLYTDHTYEEDYYTMVDFV